MAAWALSATLVSLLGSVALSECCSHFAVVPMQKVCILVVTPVG